MFHDALIESSGELRSHSRRWLPLTLLFNLVIIAVMVLLPLLHPSALPRTVLTPALIAPRPPAAAPPKASAPAVRVTRSMAPLNAIVAPSRVPTRIDTSREPPPAPDAFGLAAGEMSGANNTAGVASALASGTAPVLVTARPEPPRPAGRIAVSSGVAAGALLARTMPVYPAIAKAAHVSGTVLLHAVISKSGTIESLRVLSGPEMLRASALDAVQQWRYRPYLLNNTPTEVETTIAVNFSFGA